MARKLGKVLIHSYVNCSSGPDLFRGSVNTWGSGGTLDPWGTKDPQ